ncbi:oxygenase MpaB family protein [Parapedobacter tibetensis]|uniref:oxygenase MpaB family protein n=1 Tax=Parapedobacter tibetensis TaxID=2972951 RepID=UPI00214DD659|nr:oxygenase MpaB family protein [Parapedobacter tibetensis]
MENFVSKDSVVRRIWGNGDTILLIFAGASAEFALNKAVDWLYFTGRLPSDPLKRLFSTVSYARQIVFSDYDDAMHAIDKISAIHKGVENQRGKSIPDWAYRDVLFMLIDYSIRSYELLERKLSTIEKEEVFNVFHRMGSRMLVKDLPPNYQQWLLMRTSALHENLLSGNFTKDLYKQYQKHLGWFRFLILKQTQRLLVPEKVNELLDLGKNPFAAIMLKLYKLSRIIRVKSFLKNAILPPAYKKEIIALDSYSRSS